MANRLLWTLLLLSLTAAWGWAFTLVRYAVAIYHPLGFLALRFLTAAAVIFLLTRPRLSRQTLRYGIAAGAALALGFLGQTFALQFTTASNSAIITEAAVIFAPLTARLAFGTRTRPQTWLSIALCCAGALLLMGQSPEHMRLGDLLSLAGALGFGIHLALLSEFSPRLDSKAFAAVQIATVALFAFIAWPLAEPIRPPPPQLWWIVLFTGTVATAAGFWIQTLVQRRLSAARTALILATEPAFAVLFGILAGEHLAPLQWLGAALMLAAVLAHEIWAILHSSKRQSGTSQLNL
jgi:drug/metabolite transporter (DMT)-like permease